MNAPHPFTHCPRCGAAGLAFDGVQRFACAACAFVFFQNTAAACGAILLHEGRVLLLVRGHEPAAGMLDFPGGFINPGESAEAALQREIAEEIGVAAHDLRYFCSAPNRYLYRGVDYATCDLVFTGRLTELPTALQAGEIAGYELVAPAEMVVERIAFPSLRGAMQRYLSWTRDGGAYYSV